MAILLEICWEEIAEEIFLFVYRYVLDVWPGVWILAIFKSDEEENKNENEDFCFRISYYKIKSIYYP